MPNQNVADHSLREHAALALLVAALPHYLAKLRKGEHFDPKEAASDAVGMADYLIGALEGDMA